MDTTPSARPWAVERDGQDHILIGAPKPNDDARYLWVAEITPNGDGIDAANAALIVRAVNSHDALRDALEHAVVILHNLANPPSRSAEGMKRGRSEARRGENIVRAALDSVREMEDA